MLIDNPLVNLINSCGQRIVLYRWIFVLRMRYLVRGACTDMHKKQETGLTLLSCAFEIVVNSTLR